MTIWLAAESADRGRPRPSWGTIFRGIETAGLVYLGFSIMHSTCSPLRHLLLGQWEINAHAPAKPWEGGHGTTLCERVDYAASCAHGCALMESSTSKHPTSPPLRNEGECQTFYVDDARVQRAAASLPDTAVLTQMAETFGVLSDPTRLRILLALDQEELCVCDLARLVKRSMPATSHQLQMLRRLRLVTYRMQGRLAYYSLAETSLRVLLRDARSRLALDGAA
jgi:DNA-binding transcriptional ArsR family regulator